MRISTKISQVKPSATLAVSAKAMELRAQGRDIISLSVGEPDFDTPQHIRDAAKQALDDGFTRYTQVPGIPELRDAVAQYFNSHYGTNAKADCTIVTNGGKQALYNLLLCLLNPGEEVLIPGPYWVSYPAMVELADGVPVTVSAPASKGFKIDVEQLEAARTEKTRVLILNSPSNPTGAQYTEAELFAIAEWAVAHDVFIISDEIYDQLVYGSAGSVSLSSFWEKHPEHVAVVNGLSKSFAMTGWRIGYALAHPDLIKAMSRVQSQSTSNICSIAQRAALAALTGPTDMLEDMRQAFVRRRDKAMAIVSGWKGVVCPKPEGAFYLFPDVSALYGERFADSASLCTLLLEEAGVATVPGVAFGDDNCIRFSYALADETVEKALKKIEAVLYK
ncbi:pyridoxal phosphate-dependent aminotransferase [Desulfobaculum bizertense]|uniref:Aminotransferase n=1 Tax=Desulfobaculum bizertense DSM 18034 TaxID=1121442 RepID=A0A1T4X433_9BACT|nr:pyridoxal phosphate-dependent aminotransferase [Desulfobaculum bizertense]SKA83888.1 aspartate aminotransferase [Desulfobaculum bizertense DSM 18034]